MTGNLAIVPTEDDAMPAACCEACEDTNQKIRNLHALAEEFFNQMQKGGGPMGMIMKMMGGR